jgi:hypothetical protein
MAIKINGQRVVDTTSGGGLLVGKNAGSPYINASNTTIVGSSIALNRAPAFNYNLDEKNTLIGSRIASGYSIWEYQNFTSQNIIGTIRDGSIKSTASSESYATLDVVAEMTIKFKITSLANFKVGLYEGSGSADYNSSNSMLYGVEFRSDGSTRFKTQFGYGGGLHVPHYAGDTIEIWIRNGLLRVYRNGATIWEDTGLSYPSLLYPIITFGTSGAELTDLVYLNKVYSNSQISSDNLFNNTMIGYKVANSLTASDDSIFIGNESAYNAISSTQSVVIGNLALSGTTQANAATAIGYKALKVNTTGSSVVALGHYAGFNNTTGSNNTYLGAYTGLGTQNESAWSNLNGSNNTLLGYQAAPSANTASNQITLGNASITSLRCAVTSITSLSDSRDKDNITPLSYGIDFVNALNPVAFTWNSRDGSKVGIKSSGFLAQDLKATQDSFNAADTLNLVHDANPDKLEATYGNLIPVLVKAVQELSQKVSVLEAQLAA